MAIRARLAAPPVEAPKSWPFHTAKHTSISSHLLWGGDRRMEAETYLSSGYGIRLALEERAVGWQRLGQIARIWQPSRLKGILVGPEFGTPFLAATQVFDIRPMPRKWLALSRTENASERFVAAGTILVTCSGAVGRVTLARDTYANTLISHDLLRVEPRDPAQWGWLYAYLRSKQAREMMSGAQYGHIIKHLETGHLNELPIPIVKPKIAAGFQERAQAILDLRNRTHRLAIQAEDEFSAAIGPIKQTEKEIGFDIKASQLFATRRRLEASYYAPGATAVLARYKAMKANVMTLSQLAEKVWWMSRFRRFYGEAGIPYLSADELFTTNPSESKRILVDSGDGHEDFYVKRDWLVMACSGQIYGLNGAAALMTEDHERTFFSHDLIRVIPKQDEIRPGYLLTALTHPTLGRPLLIRAAYGTSIPHLDPGDISNFPVVRLSPRKESSIADLAEESASERARADVLERELADDAGKLIEKFLSGDTVSFVTTMPTITDSRPSGSPSALPEHARVRLLRAFPDLGLSAGAEGTIVFVYNDGEGYEVEFLKEKSRPVVLTVEASDIALVEE